jgi:polar amino acid transport system substrate-binding protein
MRPSIKQSAIAHCTVFLVVFVTLASVCAKSTQAVDFVDYVDPWIESDKSRFFFFASACRPFGMMNLSPDSRPKGAWGSGYHYSDPEILGFSHVHAWMLSGITVMPTSGPVNPIDGASGWKSAKDTSKEIVRPGYHKVRLDKYAIGVELKIIQMPFNELLPTLEAKKVDIIMSGMTMTTPRNAKVIFLGPYIYSGKSILTMAHIYIEMENTNELNKSSNKIATLAGSTSEKFVLQYMPKAKLLAESNYDDCLKLVLDGKADLMLADFSICRYTVLKSPELGLETFDEPITKEPIGMAIKHTDPLFLNLLQNLLRQRDADGTLEDLNDKWFWDDEWITDVK